MREVFVKDYAADLKMIFTQLFHGSAIEHFNFDGFFCGIGILIAPQKNMFGIHRAKQRIAFTLQQIRRASGFEGLRIGVFDFMALPVRRFFRPRGGQNKNKRGEKHSNSLRGPRDEDEE